MPSWRFKETGSDWPFIQIVAPADLRLVTRPTDRRPVPRPGPVEVVAKIFGHSSVDVMVRVGDGPENRMTPVSGTPLWTASVELSVGLHHVRVSTGVDRDAIQLLVRPEDDIPRRGSLVAPGCDAHSLGAWTERGIEGTRLGPNRNGGRP